MAPSLISTAVPAHTGGAALFSMSGTGPVSGVSGTGALSGPFFIQEQSLNYDYVRVPYGFLSSVVVSLSGSTWNAVNTGSVLMVRATANYNVRKSYEWFETSSFQQGQRFSIEAASADSQGNTYCNQTPSDCGLASFSSTYGPAGRVYTSQKWYKREPWIEGQHEETDQTVVGYNYQAYNDNGSIPDPQSGTNAMDAELVWGDFKSTFSTDNIDGEQGMTARMWTEVAPKQGTYSYGQDLVDDVINNTDMLGDHFNLGGLFSQQGPQVTLFPYRWTRHDWT
tara:strand:+ start:1467 stop:2309 length:843 start_codon:yes stop_codon:yes gene_type:complete